MRPEDKLQFDKAAEALGLDRETRDRAWRRMTDLGIPPSDPTSIFIVLAGLIDKVSGLVLESNAALPARIFCFFCSVRLSHSPQSGQRPSHFRLSYPHWLQINNHCSLVAIRFFSYSIMNEQLPITRLPTTDSKLQPMKSKPDLCLIHLKNEE